MGLNALISPFCRHTGYEMESCGIELKSIKKAKQSSSKGPEAGTSLSYSYQSPVKTGQSAAIVVILPQSP